MTYTAHLQTPTDVSKNNIQTLYVVHTHCFSSKKQHTNATHLGLLFLIHSFI